MFPAALSFDDVTAFIGTWIGNPFILAGLAAILGLKLLPRVLRTIKKVF